MASPQLALRGDGESSTAYHTMPWPAPQPSIPACKAQRETRTIVAHVPPKAPLSWAEALQTQLDRDAGDCYSAEDRPRNLSKNHFGERRVYEASCCCSYWDETRTEPSVRSLMQLPGSTKTHEPGCVRSFPMAVSKPVSAQTSPPRRCDIAVTVSGGIGWRTNGFACSMDSLARNVLQSQQQACVFVHAGLMRATTLKLANQVASSVVDTLARHPSVVGYEIEANDMRTRKSIFNATEHCTRSGQIIGTLFGAIGSRHKKFQDKARYSFASMFRHIWLAYRMAHEHELLSGSRFRFIIRSRVDHTYSAGFDWPLVERLAAPSPGAPLGRLLIGQPHHYHKLASRDGVPHRHRCVMNDQFAVGPPALMDAYASLYPDFSDFRRLVPLGRNDLVGHTNERILVSHLHYRGVGKTFTSFPLHADIAYAGCGTSHRFLDSNRSKN